MDKSNLEYYELTCCDPYWRGSDEDILIISSILLEHKINYEVKDDAIIPTEEFDKAKDAVVKYFLKDGESWNTL